MSELERNVHVKIGSEKGFGVVFAIVFSLIGLYPLVVGDGVRLWALIAALLFVLLAYLAPKALSVPNKIWFKFGMALGNIVSPIVMAVVYFIAVMPIGLIFKLMKKDLLQERLYKNAKSYWIERSQPVGPMKKQF